MKKWITLPVIVGLLAGLWVSGGLSTPGRTLYQVTENPGGAARLDLVVERPGMFVDFILPAGTQPNDSRLFAPWPGTRRRALAFWRSPLVLTLHEGAGPFSLPDLPVPLRGGQPALELPAGWRQVGQYIGKLEVVQTEPLLVAAGPDVADSRKAAEQATALFTAAGHLFGVPSDFGPQAVAYTDPAETARSIARLWLPGLSDPEAGWWQRGAVSYYTMRLMDQAELWDKQVRNDWVQAHSEDQEFLLIVWLDMSIRYQSKERHSLANVVPLTRSAASNADLLAAVESVSGLGVRDRLERMLQGKEPLPRVNADLDGQ